MQQTLASALGLDFSVTYKHTSGAVVVATLTDDPSGAGVYLSTVTLTQTGAYSLQVLLRGLEVPTTLTSLI